MFDLMHKISQGRPEPLKLVVDILSIDRKYLLILEKLGLFGRQLYLLWNECCQADMEKFIRLLEKFDEGELSQTFIRKHVRKTRGINIEV